MLKAAEYESLTREEKRKYLKTVHMRGDYQNTIDFAREQGHEAGFAEGMEKGIEKERINNARNMLADGVPVEQVAKWTGLTADVIKRL